MKMTRMRGLTALVVVGLLAAAAGCNEDQLRRADRIFGDVNSVGQTIAQLPDSPAGPLIPPDVAAIMKILGIGAAGAYAVWQKIRANGTMKTLKAVTAGVEATDEAVQATVKGAVGEAMKAAGIYARGKAIVNEAKNT